MIIRTLLTLTLYISFFINTAQAVEVEFIGNKVQGGLVIGKVLPGFKIRYNNKMLRISERGYFLIGFSRNEKAVASYTLIYPNGESQQRQIKIKQRKYKQEIINGLATNKVKPSKKELDRVYREQKYFNQARRIDEASTNFLQSFIMPVKGRISGEYGSRRVLNGEAKRPHYGLDIAAPEGTPIKAPIAGKVTLNQNDLFYTGVTVMLDHGHGLSTLYVHMKESFVTLGDTVQQGDIIGSVGATGRATGPHLHWGMSLFNTRLDPYLTLKNN